MDELGDRITPMQQAELRRQHMRIRTIAVSFAAAVTSARQDMDVGVAERDALIETWRAWSLGVLDRYAADLRGLSDTDDQFAADELAGVRSALAEAIERVRSA